MTTDTLKAIVRVRSLLGQAQVLLEDANQTAFQAETAFSIGFLDRLHILVLEGQGLIREAPGKTGIPEVKEATS